MRTRRRIETRKRVSSPVEAASENAAGWLTPWRFGSLLGLLIFVCFPQVLLGLDAFVYGDAGQFAYPIAFHHREAFRAGEIPLWNPFSSCGIPFLAQWNTLTFYPLSLFYVLLPVPWGFGVFCLGHLFVAGLGMYFLAHRWTGSRLAAGVAGATFCFNGLTWYGLMWPHLLAAVAWMPWLVLAMERAWSSGRRYTLVAALVGALQLLSGGAEVILQTWVVLGLLWLAALFRGGVSRWKMAGRTVAAGCLAAGIAAVQLLPFLDLLAHSQRSAGYSGGGMAAVAAMPFTGWLNYIVPLFRCAPNPNGVFVQIGQSWTGSYYLGIGVVLLAGLGLWRMRVWRVWLLAGLAVFSLLMALGSKGVVHDWLKWLFPPLGFIRFPVKFLYLATFAFPVLAAFGLTYLQRAQEHKLEGGDWPGKWRRAWLLGAVLIGLIVAILCFGWSYPVEGSRFATTAVNGCVRGLFLAGILACLWLLSHQSALKSQRLLQTGLVVLLWFDVYTHSSNLSPTVPSAALEPDSVRRFFKWDDRLALGASRVMESKATAWALLAGGTADLEQDTTGRRLALFLNFNLLDHTPKFDGFYSMDLKEYLEMFKQVYFTTNEASGLKDFLGISQVNNPTNIVDWVPRDSFLPLVTAGQRPQFVGESETIERLVAPDFDPRLTVYLPLEARGSIRASRPALVKLLSRGFSAGRVAIELDAEAPAVVVIAQSYYHAWHAYVDGQRTPLWRANYAFQALEVGAGRHKVNLVYEDRAFRFGAILSGCMLVLTALLWFAWRPTLGQPGHRPDNVSREAPQVKQ